MNSLTKLKFSILMFLALLPLSAIGDWGCSSEDIQDYQRYAKEVISSFPKISEDEMRFGKFSSKYNYNTGELRIAFISYINGKKLFDVVTPNAPGDVSCSARVSLPMKGRAKNSILFTVGCGSGHISTGCDVEIYPGWKKDGSFGWEFRIIDDPS